MFKLKQTFKKVMYFPITRIFLGVLVCTFIQVTLKNILVKPLLGIIFEDIHLSKAIQHGLSIIIALFTYYFVFKIYEKRKIKELTLSYFWKDSLLGLGLGYSSISVIIILLSLMGYYSIISYNQMDLFFFSMVNIALLALTEEIIYRGIIYRILENWLGTKIALIIPALFFGLAHITNDNISIIGLSGVIVGGLTLNVMYCYTKRLWLPIFFHFGWNLSQMIYGSNISGIDTYNSLLKIKLEGPKYIVGSGFGIEDSILAVFVCLVLVVAFLFLCIKNQTFIKPKWIKD